MRAKHWLLAAIGVVVTASPAISSSAVAAGGPARKCPEGAKWQVVADNRPLKECGDKPLEQGCMLSDGRKHGTWIVYEQRLKCASRAMHSTYKQGRKHGHEWVWQVVCSGKAGADKCRSLLKEQGDYVQDRRHGTWTEFHDDGKKAAKGPYFKGTKQGPWTLFSTAGRAQTVRCMSDGKQTWEDTAAAVAGKARACAVTREEKAGDGTRVISAAEAKASKMVALAQRATKSRLKILYLEKALQLAPDNKRYQKLLEAARKAAVEEKKDRAADKSAPADAP